MQNQKAGNSVKIVAILSVAAAIATVLWMQAATAAQDRPQRLFEIVGMDVPLEKRFGADDGAALVVHFMGDTRGSLDTCG